MHIYRLISERTVEENILKKANQKRLLGDIAIEGGSFTTAFFKEVSDLLGSLKYAHINRLYYKDMSIIADLSCRNGRRKNA